MEDGISLCLHVLAGGEDVLHQLHVVEHQGQAQGLGVTVELPEDVQGALQQRRVLRLGDVAHAAGGEKEREQECEGCKGETG